MNYAVQLLGSHIAYLTQVTFFQIKRTNYTYSKCISFDWALYIK